MGYSRQSTAGRAGVHSTLLLGAMGMVMTLLLLAGPTNAVTVSSTPQTTYNFTGNATVDIYNPEVMPPFIPLTDSIMLPAPGCAPEQVRLTYWSSTATKVNFLVTFATCGYQYNDSVAGPQAPPKTPPYVWVGNADGVYKTRFTGVTTSYLGNFTDTGGSKYASPLLHHVLLKGLTPGTTYYYKIQDLTSEAPLGRHLLSDESAGAGAGGRDLLQDAAAAADVLPAGPVRPRATKPPTEWGPNPFSSSFKVPTAGFPFSVGVWGDPAQLINETDIISQLTSSSYQMFWMMGDLTYADNFENIDAVPESACTGEEKACIDTTPAYGPRWDSFGRLVQPLLSQRPALYTNGNHEIEMAPLNGSQWDFATRSQNYNYRYPLPSSGAAQTKGPSTFGPVTPKAKTANMYGSVEIAGVAKVIMLSSYIPQDDFSTKSEQYLFLARELKAVNRKRTPWLVVIMHAPFYSTYTKHYKEPECMRATYEPLMSKYSVDLVLSGHDHAYERILPVFNYTVGASKCAPMYSVAGNGCGDELTFGYVDIDRTIQKSKGPYKYCLNNETGVDGAAFNTSLARYQKAACAIWNLPLPGGPTTFCPDAQPDYSAYRESVLGHIGLTFDSATQATWKFYRINENAPADTVTITRHPQDCGLKA